MVGCLAPPSLSCYAAGVLTGHDQAVTAAAVEESRILAISDVRRNYGHLLYSLHIELSHGQPAVD